jgi:hypothetical protein
MHLLKKKKNNNNARVESVREKDFKILPSSAIRIKKKKVKFKKGIIVSKISRFNKYI